MLDFAMVGRYYPPQGFKTEDAVREAYQQLGLDFDRFAGQSRALGSQFPFENLVPMGSWSTSGGIKYIGSDGKTIVDMPSPGIITTSQYEASFERAVGHMEVALMRSDSGPMLDSLVAGVSAIEAYVSHRVAIWNAANPSALLTETPPRRMPFDAKVREWIPAMTGGRQIDMGVAPWQVFDRLRNLRDKRQSHANVASFGTTYIELAQIINDFGLGIAGLLRLLHLIFEEQVPPVVLRACYMPIVTAELI